MPRLEGFNKYQPMLEMLDSYSPLRTVDSGNRASSNRTSNIKNSSLGKVKYININ